MRYVFGILGLAGILLAVGCGSGEENAAAVVESAAALQGANVDIELSEDDKAVSMTFKDEEGRTQQLDFQGGDSDTFEMNLQGEAGGMRMTGGAKAEIPEGFAGDVPLYPDMTPTMVQELGGQGAANIVATSPDPVEKVAGFYEEHCREQGWSQLMQASNSGVHVTSYNKGQRKLTVTIAPGDGETNITLMHQDPQ